MKDETMPLNERIEAAVKRITTGHAAMRVPAEATDPDLVLSDCAARIADLEAMLREAEGQLEGCEWCWGTYEDPCCPACGGHEDHEADCPLDTILTKIHSAGLLPKEKE